MRSPKTAPTHASVHPAWRFLAAALAVVIFAAAPLAARAASCAFDGRGAGALPLPGRPFGVQVTPDGCWLFISLYGDPPAGGAIAVLRNAQGGFRLDHVVKVPGHPTGLSLAVNGQLLAVAAQDRILLLGAASLERGDRQPIVAGVTEPANVGAVYAQFALGDRWLFVSEEWRSRIAVVDVARAGQGDGAHAIMGHVPTGQGPVGLALSPDGLRLYATSEIGPPSVAFPSHCAISGPAGRALVPEGELLAIDVRAAVSAPDKSVVAAWAAGCSPVRVALSPDGGAAWVTARGDGEVRAFLTRGASVASSTASVRRKVGPSPVGLAVRPDGGQLWVANSDRFSASGAGSLTCLSLKGGGERDVASGRFPREMTFLPDGRTLVVTEFGSDALQFVPTAVQGRAAGKC